MNDQPNIVFILPDQLRPDFLSTYGASFIDTPNIDRIANEGIRYTRPYSAYPVCVPARPAPPANGPAPGRRRPVIKRLDLRPGHVGQAHAERRR